MENPLISVIVPVFNVETYVSRCISSILNQTYKNLEILLIDDGSTDSSGKICDSFAEKDTRLNVIHCKNHGVAAARNRGIEISKGTYISFIDSDDFIELDFYEYLMNLVRTTNCDVAYCSYRRIPEEKAD